MGAPYGSRRSRSRRVPLLLSTLTCHELTTEVCHEVYVTLPRGRRVPSLGYLPHSGFRISGNAFGWVPNFLYHQAD